MPFNSKPKTQNPKLSAKVFDMRFESTFRKIKSIFEPEAIPMILLKGPHLAHAVYEHPGERIYSDLDILVKPGDFKKAANVLLKNQFVLVEEDDKNLATMAQTNHWVFQSPLGQIIELHRGFTGQQRHPGDMDEWFARAQGFNFGQTPALGLGSEDLLCHLCLHIGKSFFHIIEKKHIRDIDVLIRKRPLQWEVFTKRCRETRSKAIAYYCLRAAQGQFDTPIPVAVLATLRPGKLRRFWLDKHLDVNVFPIYRFYGRGAGHARMRLTLPLLDGFASWLPFLVRVAMVKGLDIVLRVQVLKRWWIRKNSFKC
jgi:hypothetical protein